MSTTETVPAATGGMPDRTAIIAEVREFFLDRVVRSVRAAGVESPASLEALRAGAAQLLDQMTTEGARTGFAVANSLTASQIRLVDDNQLELSIRLGDIAKHLRDECATSMYKFHQRFVTLLDRPSLRVADDPLSPEAVCRALAEMFGSSDESHLAAIARLTDIEAQFAAELPLMYAELAELLVRRQIAPARLQSAVSDARPGDGSGRRGGEGGDGGAMAALQQLVMARLGPAGGMAGGPGTGAGGGPGGGGGFPVGGGFGASIDTGPRFEQVMDQIDHWQAETQGDLFGGSARQVAGNALQTLRTHEAMSRLRAQDAVALDVLSVLFDAVFDDARLAPAVKAAVARLQIPVLKSAILSDTSFFTDSHQPARALLSAMGEAAIGLEPTVEAEHPVCVELQRVAAGIQGEFQRDAEVFSRYCAELESFMARRHHDLQGSAHAYIVLAKAQEDRDVALRAAWRLVASRTFSAPRVVADFLREHWTRVLADDSLSGGQHGEPWQADERVLEDLLWSIQPKSDPEERRRLGQLVPELLGRIKAGLDRVEVPAEARAPFLDACFALQAAAIRGRVSPPPAPTAPAAASVDADSVVVLAADGASLKSIRSANPDARASGEVVSELVIGDWVEFLMPDDKLSCGRLCWISPDLGNPLFMNPAWDCAISVARSSLERQFAAGQASTGGTLSFFDNAVEKALHKSIAAKA